MQDFSELRPSRLWKKLSPERRLAAAELFWSDDQSTEQQIEAVGALASHMKFRPKSVISLPLERKAKYLSTLPTVSDRSEEHTSELQSRSDLVCRLLLE